METVLPAEDQVTATDRVPTGAGGLGGARRLVARANETWLAPTSSVPTWIGVVVAALGFVVIAYGWSKIAALLAVPLQMPYLISAGFTGLGLICVGIGIVAVQAKRRETAARTRQLEEIREMVALLDRRLGSGGPGGA